MTSPEPTRPILAVDVDGVVAIFGFEELPDSLPARFEMIDGLVRCIPAGAGERLRRLSAHFDLVWASGWEGRVERLAALIDLPGYPHLSFGGRARFGSADWKLEPLADYARGRALAWIDDSFDARCYEWAEEREEPTLLLAADSHIGLADAHEEALRSWALGLG